MAKVNLKKITFSNLLSYGAEDTVIELQKGMNWIRGSNGYGKSTIIEAINFALFGKAYRDISLPSLINNYNRKKLLVELELERVIGDKSTTFIIKRGLKPKKFEIYKGTVSKESRLDEEGKAGIFQTYLETEILGFNETLFKQTIAMSAMSSTPFLEMSKAEKRKFMEAILGVSDIEKIKKAFGADLSGLKSDFLQTSSRLPERQSKLEELEDLLENAKKEKSNDISALKDDIIELEEKISTQSISLSELTAERDAKKADGKVVADEYDEYKSVVSDIASGESDIRNLKGNIERGNSRVSELESMIAELSDFTEKGLSSLQASATSLKNEITGLDDLKEERSSQRHIIKSGNDKIDSLKRHLDDHGVGVPCDRCKRPYTESDFGSIKQSVDQEISAYVKAIDAASSKVDKISEDISVIEKSKKKYEELVEEGISYRTTLAKSTSAQEELARVSAEISGNVDGIKSAEEKVEQLKGKVTTAELLNAKLGKLRAEYLELNTSVQVAESSISNWQESIDKIKRTMQEREGKKLDDVISTTETKIENAKKAISASQSKVTELSNEIDVLNYIVKMFGDEGIKEYMVKKYIPVLNKSIGKVLKSFGVPFSISFDSGMGHTFDNSFGLAKEYKGLSEGQKRRLNFSIYIAFRDFVNKIGRFTINTLFLDEILDTAMDDSGLEDMISIIKGKVDELGSVYLISHKMNSLNEEFENILEVTFDGTFSKIEKV